MKQTRLWIASVATVLALTSIVPPPAAAVDVLNAPSIVDGHTWGCGGLSPVINTCDAGAQELSGSGNWYIGMQLCDYVGLVYSCLPADLLYKGSISLFISGPSGLFESRCEFPLGTCTDTMTGAFYNGDFVRLYGEAHPTRDLVLDSTIVQTHAGYWRVYSWFE